MGTKATHHLPLGVDVPVALNSSGVTTPLTKPQPSDADLGAIPPAPTGPAAQLNRLVVVPAVRKPSRRTETY